MNENHIQIESEEDGFWLHIWSDQYSKRFRITDLDAFYDQVRSRIGPYLRERDEALASRPVPLYDGGYEMSDPKHPEFHSVHADIWDARDGK